MTYLEIEGIQPSSFAMTDPIPDTPAISPPLSDTALPHDNRTLSDTLLHDFRTWNWIEAAIEVGVNESTLRTRWWEAKIEPAYRHCPNPLRVVVRTTKAGKQFEEFTVHGIEVLKSYKAALSLGELAAENLLSEAKNKYPEPPEVPQPVDRIAEAETTEPEPEARSLTVEVGNHQIVLANPELPQTFSLEGLRHSEAVSIEDPLALAAQILQAADLITATMQTDIQQREQKLDDTRKAKDQIATKAQELKLESRLYQMQTDTLDKAVSQETSALQDALDTLKNLGKSEAVS